MRWRTDESSTDALNNQRHGGLTYNKSMNSIVRCCSRKRTNAAATWWRAGIHQLQQQHQYLHRFLSSASSSSSPSSSSLPPILFVLGGPGAGKGTQSQLLVREFGADIRGTNDGTIIEQHISNNIQRLYATATQRQRPQQERWGLVHVSIGALLRKEQQTDSENTADHSSSLLHAASGGNSRLI